MASLETFLPLQIRVCSWNLHGSRVDSRDDIMEWLAPQGRRADMYVIGVQELVELSAKTFMSHKKDGARRLRGLQARLSVAFEQLNERFDVVCAFGMVGLALLIFCRQGLSPCITELDLDRVKTGLDGNYGNKGCVCARMIIGTFSACFMNVHLSSGQNAVEDRNNDLQTVLGEAFQARSSRGHRRNPKHGFRRESRHHAAHHQFCVLFGDLNSRLDLLQEEELPPGPLEGLLPWDQLLRGRMTSQANFVEGSVKFAPTYKYKPGTCRLDTSRHPAWCDRALYKTDGGIFAEQLEYSSFPQLCFTSDHRPIAVHFVINADAEAPTSLFEGIQEANEAPFPSPGISATEGELQAACSDSDLVKPCFSRQQCRVFGAR